MLHESVDQVSEIGVVQTTRTPIFENLELIYSAILS